MRFYAGTLTLTDSGLSWEPGQQFPLEANFLNTSAPALAASPVAIAGVGQVGSATHEATGAIVGAAHIFGVGQAIASGSGAIIVSGETVVGSGQIRWQNSKNVRLNLIFLSGIPNRFATVAGVAKGIVTGSGDLVASNRVLIGTGTDLYTVRGTPHAEAAEVDGSGSVGTSAHGALQSGYFALGSLKAIRGRAALDIFGSGVLRAKASVVGKRGKVSGKAISKSGSTKGILADTRAIVFGRGSTSHPDVGALIVGFSQVAGQATASFPTLTGTGVLHASTIRIAGLAENRGDQIGRLNVADATVVGVAELISEIEADLICVPATITTAIFTGLPAFAEGSLFASDAEVQGIGESIASGVGAIAGANVIVTNYAFGNISLIDGGAIELVFDDEDSIVLEFIETEGTLIVDFEDAIA